jgi:hypothetical protein
LAELLRERAHSPVRHPQQLTMDDLVGADLVLVDYRLERWAEREAAGSMSLQPMNGLALAGVLRAHIDQIEKDDESAHSWPTAIALHSAHLADISGGLPVEIRPHALARANNLEWAFEKKTVRSSTRSLPDQLVSLADAVRQLPGLWPADSDKVNDLAKRFFGLSSDSPWCGQAWEEVEECHPPLHELSKASHGLALLRWLLHRILPYPCFLLDEWHLAARLGVERNELHRALDEEAFAGAFKSVQYTGSLSTFLGLRWWRSGVEWLLWDITDAQSFDPELTRQRLSQRTGVFIEPSTSGNAVVCLDESYRALSILCSPDEAVRIQPDDWPPFAEQAWTTINLVREHALLRSLVVHADKDRLDSVTSSCRGDVREA